MYQPKECDLSELLKSILQEEQHNRFTLDGIVTTLGAMYVAHEDGDMVYSHKYTYCNELQSIRVDLLYRLLSNQLPPIRLYLTVSRTGKDIILSKADRLMDLFWFMDNRSTISSYSYKDLKDYKFKLRQHRVECFYFDSEIVDREYLSTLLDVPSVFYPEIQQKLKA